MINPYAVYNNLSLYRSVTGRVLISCISPEKRAEIIRSAGFPGDEWDEAGTSACVETKCASIRKAGISVMVNPEKEIKAFAVPVFDSDKNICASLGLTVPLHRINKEYEKTILDSLFKNAESLKSAIASEKLLQKDFMKNI